MLLLLNLFTIVLIFILIKSYLFLNSGERGRTQHHSLSRDPRSLGPRIPKEKAKGNKKEGQARRRREAEKEETKKGRRRIPNQSCTVTRKAALFHKHKHTDTLCIRPTPVKESSQTPHERRKEKVGEGVRDRVGVAHIHPSIQKSESEKRSESAQGGTARGPRDKREREFQRRDAPKCNLIYLT